MKTEKTIREWFNTLPADQCKKAIKNSGDILEMKVSSLAGAISAAFEWAKSPEGFDYWANIACKHEFKNEEEKI
jgi:hypothetical protein